MKLYEADEHAKETYARFGLAFYKAQVLEHGIVNALIVLDLIPSRLHSVQSRQEWSLAVDAFMNGHFETTMGRILGSLQSVTKVPAEVEDLLRDALRRRNWLAHDFFRERASEFLSISGRDRMIAELEECRSCFESAATALEQLVLPLEEAAGLTPERVEKEFQRLKAEAEARDSEPLHGPQR